MDSRKMEALEALREQKSLWQIDKETKCIHWMGKMKKKKYPSFYHNGHEYGVRSLVYEANFRAVIGFFVKMTCGNHDCINPKHMAEREGIRRK
jgi:6-phosphogluconate dehydrogenase